MTAREPGHDIDMTFLGLGSAQKHSDPAHT